MFNDLARLKLTLFWSKTKPMMSVCNIYLYVLKRDFSHLREYNTFTFRQQCAHVIKCSISEQVNGYAPISWLSPQFGINKSHLSSFVKCTGQINSRKVLRLHNKHCSEHGSTCIGGWIYAERRPELTSK